MSLPRPVLDSIPTDLLRLVNHRPQTQTRTLIPQPQTKPPPPPPPSVRQPTPTPNPFDKHQKQMIEYRRKLEKEKRQLLKKIKDSDERLMEFGSEGRRGQSMVLMYHQRESLKEAMENYFMEKLSKEGSPAKKVSLHVSNVVLLPSIRSTIKKEARRKGNYSLNKFRVKQELSAELYPIEEEDKYVLEPWK